MKAVVVKNYRRRRQMQRSVNKMYAKGYVVQSQSGQLSRLGAFNPKILTVTFVLREQADEE